MAESDLVLNLKVDKSLALNASVHPLIGKIISDDVLNSEEVVYLIHERWDENKYGKVHVTHLENNLYIFSFDSGASAERVIRDEPWTMMGCFVCFQHWNNASMNVKEVALTHIPIWVQVHGLKLDQMTEKNAKLIGNYIGEHLETDKHSLNHSLQRGFLRMKVLLDCHAVVKAGMWVTRKGEATKYPIDFRYERMAALCCNCGRFGHSKSQCREEGLSQQQYGPRLRAREASFEFEDETRFRTWSNVNVKQKLPMRQRIKSGLKSTGIGLSLAVWIIVLVGLMMYSLYKFIKLLLYHGKR